MAVPFLGDPQRYEKPVNPSTKLNSNPFEPHSTNMESTIEHHQTSLIPIKSLHPVSSRVLTRLWFHPSGHDPLVILHSYGKKHTHNFEQVNHQTKCLFSTAMLHYQRTMWIKEPPETMV